MFKVDSTPLLTEDIVVLEKLRTELKNRNIDLFRKFIVNELNIQFTCPFHNNGQEKKPSCGISRKDVIKQGKTVPAGTVHCFTCGWTGTIAEMVSHVFGRETDFGKFGRRWLLTNFVSLKIEDRSVIIPKLRQFEQNYVTEEELDSYRYIHPYMYKRKLTDEIIDKFDVGYDPDFKLVKDGNKIPCITFPVKDLKGNVVFVARRSIEGKIFHYPISVGKPVYALNEIPPNSLYFVVCESILNALRLWTRGVYATALIGLGTEQQYNLIKRSNARTIYSAFDGDVAGKQALKRLKLYLGKYKIIKELPIPDEKDVNSLSELELNNLISLIKN